MPRDLTLGLRWLEKAAATGNYWATADMARLHAEGWYGLPRDAAKARSWMEGLAALGHLESRGWLSLHGYPVPPLVGAGD